MSWNGTNMYPSSDLLGQDKDESIVALLINEVIEKAYDFAVVFPDLQRKCFPREMGAQEEVGDGCKTNCFRGWNKWWLKKVILMESDDSICPSKSRALCGGPPRTPLSPPLFTLFEQASRSCSKSQSRCKSHSRSRSRSRSLQTQQKIRTKMVAPGGEALGGVIGAFRHMIETEGFFSLYKGLVPSIISMAPSGAVFYGVYDILKSTYLHSPNGRKRLQHMKEAGHGLNALEQMELGTLRTLMYGEIAGCCAEAATYPFEVVRRQLQMQVRATKMSATATFIKIVDQVAYLPCMQV